jgi:acyl-CoA synthetase (AMP-forming)/AMP-acid ligase II
VPLSTFSTRAELVALLHGADVTVLLAASGYRTQDYRASVQAGIPELDPAAPGPLLAAAVPSLRRIAFAGGVGSETGALRPVSDPTLHDDWTMAGLLAHAGRVGDDVLAAAEAAVTPADRMVVVHTSGSTSAPKGVVHVHGALLRHLDNLNQLRRYESGEVLFSNSPFCWIGGFAYALLGTLLAGARLVCSNAPDAAGVLDVLERERPTMVNGFAASVAHLPRDPSFPERDLTSIRRGNLYPIMPAAVRPRDPELHHAMLGMTEAGSVCLADPDESEQPEHRRGSFGKPVPGFEAEVRREADGAACAPGEVGELWLRSPFLMEGYDGRERHEVFDRDGWFCTGDLVSVDADGYFFFRGRSGDMIKTAGANVSPREVEAAILEVSGLVAHVAGVDDDSRGQVVAALVRSSEPVDVDALRAQLKVRLSAYKVPRTFVVVPDADVPMMSSGKVDRRALEELLREA